MARLRSIDAQHFRIPLDVPASDSTHGVMTSFELITVKATDADDEEGVGYTYTTGHNGGAIHHILAREVPAVVAGVDCELIEAVWQKVWWALHYGGRGGAAVLALSALDMALWDLKARRAKLPLYRLLGGHDSRVPCYAGGIDLDLSVKDLLAQTDANLAKGFRAIKTKVGRDRLQEDVERIRAMRKHLGDDFPLMVDANMKWSVDEAIRRARTLREFDLVWLEEPTIPTTSPAMRE